MNQSKTREDRTDSRRSGGRSASASTSSGERGKNSQKKQKYYDVDLYDPEFYKLPVTERSKLLRAKRNREAAHRSRTKNKIRQTMLEEETKKQLQLNRELTNLMNFLLPELTISSGSSSASKTTTGERKGERKTK